MALSSLWKTDRLQRARTLTPQVLPDRYLAGLLRFAAVRLGPGGDAEDVAAETLVAAAEGWSRRPRAAASGGDDPLRAWLFGIARRKVADTLRRREREHRALPPPAPTPPIETGALTDESCARLADILAGLEDDQREVLLLKYVDGLSLNEIAVILGRTPAAVGSLLYRARAAARERGRDYFGTEAP